MAINSVTPRNATKLIELALASSLVPFLSGSPGLGKSALVRSIAKEHKLELIDYRASMGTPEDMMGLPFRDGDRSKFLPFADTFPIEGITEIPKGKNGFLLFCHHKDTEVLTEKHGFVLFSELTPEMKVAQYDMYTKEISYAIPEAYISYHKKGKLLEINQESLAFSITEDHDLVVQSKITKRTRNPKTYKRKPLETPISSDLVMPVAGFNTGIREHLTKEEKLAIAFQADGSFTHFHADGIHCSISFGFKKLEKIEQFRKNFPEADERIYGEYTHFYLNKIPKEGLSKSLRDVFNPAEWSYQGCRNWLEYVLLWDGFKMTKTSFGYGSTRKDNVKVVQEFAILAGYRCNISTAGDKRKETFSTYYKAHWYMKDTVTTQSLQKMVSVDYNDMVYCLKMPKGTLVTKYNDHILISGNCDEINAAPRSMLAALYKLILDRKVGMQNLHPDTYIICAGNRAMDRAIVNNMGTAMQSRLSHLELISNTKEWVEDVAIPMQFDSRVVAFINAYPDRLNTFDPQNEDISFACPRTWEFTNNICKQLEPDKGIPDEVIPLIAGTLGEGVAVEFVQFTQVFKDIPSLDQVLKDPEGCFIPDTPTMQWATVCSLAQKHSIEEFAKVSKYIDRYRLSFKLIYHKTILSRLPELRNEPEWAKNVVQIHKYLHTWMNLIKNC